MTNLRPSGFLGLGDIARDPQTGFEGEIIADCRFLYGCRRLTVQPPGLLPDGQPIKAHTFDEPALELVQKPETEPKEHTTGGPQPEPEWPAEPDRL